MSNFFAWFRMILTGFASKVLPPILLAAVGILAIQMVLKFTVDALKKSKLEKAAHRLILTVVKTVLYLLLGLSVAKSLGIDITGVVALASVLTLAVSLSLQNALTNMFGGFSLLHNKPFTTGDFVEISGQSGNITEIGLAYTKLTTPDNKIISIPNSSVVASQIINYTAAGTRRADITVTASYDAPVQTVLAALREAADVPTAEKEPAPFVGVNNYGDSAIEYVLQVWSSCENYRDTLFTVKENIKTVFDAKGIEMTYPHLNVHLDK